MNAKVLLVDDEADFTEILSERMETRGMQVDVVDCGADAIDRVQKKSFDAIILDLAMPEMDGIEALKHILDVNPDLQVILLTGRATLEKAVEAVKLGAVEFLEKPADIKTLVGKIEEAQSKKAILTEKRMEKRISGLTKKKGW